MLKTIQTRLNYANVVATIALFTALGGGAYAAVKLPANSVGPRQIKTDAVRSSDVKNASLAAIDFKAGQLPAGARGAQGLPGARGAAGATGPAGAKGAAGDTGPAGATGPQGAKGDPCPPSDLLCRGPKGDTGATGAAGPQGAKGDTGATGPKGDAGATGATGSPGPTASSFASHNPDSFVIGPFEVVQVISLRDGQNGSAGGDIVVPFAGRVFVSAALRFGAPSGDAAVGCRPNIGPPGSPLAQMASQSSYANLRSLIDATVPVVGSATVGPGTYYINITCNGSGGPEFVDGTLLAWAVAS